MTLPNDTALRRDVLASCGATPEVADELLNHPGATAAPMPDALPALPIDDELQVEAWRRYEADARSMGVLPALQRALVQLRFPIRQGISQIDAYRAATRRGAHEEAAAYAPGLVAHDPDGLALVVHPTCAGHVPVLSARDRRDFVSLIQAFTERNEPVPVPGSVGAYMLAGVNDWDRVATYRAAWERDHPDEAIGGGWSDEFRRLAGRRELYQDRFIILSSGPYSGVPAADVGLNDHDWLDRSLIIRREHECTHYLVFRLTGSVPHRVLDELVADYVGIVRAFGAYRPELALRCLGLGRDSAYRAGGRLEHYRGTPPLSDAAFTVLGRVCVRAIEQLAGVSQTWPSPAATPDLLARFTFDVSRLSLEHLATSDALIPSREPGGDTPTRGAGATP
jgi:hypothetical protein